MGTPTLSEDPLDARNPGWPPDPPGYHLVEKLGEGGMGAVYRAQDLSTGQAVAIKFALGNSVLRFQREYRELRALNHPHILKVIDFKPDFRPPLMVMEYLAGEPLYRYTRTFSKGRLPLQIGLPIFIQLADALAYLHREGIIHRDLKPANLMILSDRGHPFLKVMDFGLVSPQKTLHQLTVRGQLLGTPTYMAPEQFDDPTRITPQSDLYALGLILYEAFTGQRAFDGKETQVLRQQHQTQKPIPPQKIIPDLPESLNNLILSLLEKEPGLRPRTAEMVRLALNQITPREPDAPGQPAKKIQAVAGGVILHQRYQVQRKLGEGGFGAVFLAWDTVLDVPVAIKVNRDASSEGAHQFKQEASMLARLKHPNLPRVVDYFITPQGQFLVMDFIDGENLGKILANSAKPIPEAQALDWTSQVCAALNYLHQQDPPVIHRDIKPENLILGPQNQIFLVDFGITKTDPGSKTRIGALGLSPGFSPPEQYSQSGDHTDQRSDIYALGATLYTLLTGQIPLESMVARAGGHHAIPVAQQINPSISTRTGQAIARAMQSSKQDRYQTVSEFAGALFGNIPTSAARKTILGPVFPKDVIRFLTLGLMALFLGFTGIFAFRNWPPPSTTVTPDSVRTAAAETIQTVLTVSIFPTTVPATLAPTDTPTATETPPPEPPTPTSSDTPVPVISTPLGGGGVIAFNTNQDGGHEIYLVNSDGSDLRRLTFDKSEDALPAWSPDGKKIAYQSGNVLGTISNIFILDLETGASKQITDWDCVENYAPSWSPDGEKIVFYANCADNRDIYLINIDGSSIERLTDSGWYDWFPAWSPNGQKITFTSTRNKEHQIFLMDVDGSHQQLLADGCSSSFSPDGTQIVFAQKCTEGDGEIFVMNVDGSGQQIVGEEVFGRNPSWTPDGKNIVYESLDNIALVSLAGSIEPKLIYAGPNNSNESAPVWQPVKLSTGVEPENVPMILISAGEFLMGSNDGEGNENYVHPVYLDAYYIDQNETTNALYARCVQAGICTPPRQNSSETRTSYYHDPVYANYPVLAVNWNDARTYCQWRGARLLTEAEWEKAAHGETNNLYPWGQEADCKYANFNHCTGDTVAVGSYPLGRSPFGVNDLAGNVWEWLNDWGVESYGADKAINPLGLESGLHHVVRGGAWDAEPSYIRTTDRHGLLPEAANLVTGIRCGKTP